ncbi:MAG: MFS transporter [Alphaproteobacteria bacterium]|jgi:sugar phosphate permease|nr:MFS transporter [Alphaproteobacteria bacterium]
MSTARPTRVRHIILALTIAAYFITYLDRVLLSNALPVIQKEFGFSLVTLGLIQSCYQWSYALFQIPGGWFGDRAGPRIAMTSVVVWWSIFTIVTGFSGSVTMLMICLALIGFGEAGAFPIANRALSRWMLPSERGIAQGATHAGSRLAGALTPVMVATLIATYSWHAPFFLFGLVGIVWAAIWFWFYRDVPSEHTSVNAGERQKIVAALGNPKGRPPIPWKLILSSRQMWTVAAMYFCYGYALNVFITYYPKYLDAARGYSLKEMGFFASLPLAAGVVGDICGGLFSDMIIHRTGRIKFARQSVAIVGFLIAATCCPLAVLQPDRYISAALFGLTVFGLELVVGNAWAVTLDIGGSFAGSCSAVMNFVGNLGGAIMATVTVFIVTAWGWNYAFYAVSVMALIGAALFTQIDAGRKLAPEGTSPVV